jgi:hypothetical protein
MWPDRLRGVGYGVQGAAAGYPCGWRAGSWCKMAGGDPRPTRVPEEVGRVCQIGQQLVDHSDVSSISASVTHSGIARIEMAHLLD